MATRKTSQPTLDLNAALGSGGLTFDAGGGFSSNNPLLGKITPGGVPINLNSPTPTSSNQTQNSSNNSSPTSGAEPKSVQDLINMGFTGYQGWNSKDALADYKATGGSGKGGPVTTASSTGNPLSDVNKLITDTFTSLFDQAKQKFGEYQTSHPFALDRVLADATTQAKEQVDPYYQETLNNYLTGVNRRISRSTEDTQNLLSELNAQTGTYTQNTKIQLQQALQQSGEGFADAGLLSSGKALQNMGVQQVQSGNALADFLRGQSYRENQANLANTRTKQDVGLESTMTQRDIARNQYTEEQNRANQIATEAGKSYVRGFQATLPPQLQANTGFDLLSQLGIPS